MSGSAEPLLAAGPAGPSFNERDAELVVEVFRRDGRLAGLLWKAFWKEFDAIHRDDGAFGAALKIFVARYELFLKEGA